MTGDASLPPNAPMTDLIATQNGALTPDESTSVHGEADASHEYHFPPNPRSLQEVCADVNARVEAFLSHETTAKTVKRTQEQTRISLGVIEKALRDYGFDQLSLSYNGGKDCLVLLILYLSVLHTHFTSPHGKRKTNTSTTTTHSSTANTQPTPITPEVFSHSPPHFPKTIPSIYAKPPDPFPSVSSFVAYSTTHYHLSLTHISTNPGPSTKDQSHSSPPPTNTTTNNTSTSTATTTKSPHLPLPTDTPPIISFRDAFALYLNTNPRISAIFVGTRRTDPHGNHLTHFDRTDHKWPDFMRVHPVIDWQLSEIWCFLRSPLLKDQERQGEGKENEEKWGSGDVVARFGGGGEKGGLRYCEMYDEGYTSLGGVGDTVRNPKLRCVDQDGRVRYRPAYEMTEDEEERAGRE